MNPRIWSLQIGLLVALSSLVPTALSARGEVKAFTCEFSRSATTNYEAGEFRTEIDNGDMRFTVAAIDLNKNSAQMIGNAGAAELIVVSGRQRLNFIEVVEGSGTTNLLTVFSVGNSDDTLPAVYSRHVMILDSILVSQWFGDCVAKF